jgi:hypothetical protein
MTEKAINIVQRRKDNIMMNDKQRVQVYDILLTPIECTEYSKRKPKIKSDNSAIKSTQTYYPYKQYKGEKKDIPLDPDMSDFAIGFYEILYKDILESRILNENDGFNNKEFAGDTMNSFNTIANLVKEAGPTKEKRTPMVEWPQYLQNYYKQYHCLANFWMIPMILGRTANDEYCKMNKLMQDYMDRFLSILKINFNTYKKRYKYYFHYIGSFEILANRHFLIGSYVDSSYQVKQYSEDNCDVKAMIKSIFNLIKQRAKTISESEYAEELWNYFNSLGLIRHQEQPIEPDEYPLDKEAHPYAYECPKCNRIIVNDENYSIHDMCDECSKNN